MAPSKLREALGAAKDQATIGLARAGSSDEVAADLEVAIVRATAHGEVPPADESHVQEILTLTRYSRARVAACVASVSRRLGRTRAWPVALKALALLHRLLAEGDPAYEQEVFLATTRRGRRVLDDMSRFFGVRDRARSSARDDFSAFVRAYAAYLDDRLNLRMQGRAGGGVASPRKWRLDGGGDSRFHETDWTYTADETSELVPGDKIVTDETATTGDLIVRAQQLKHLLDRFIECRPAGKARTNRVVTAALYRLVKESAEMYCELTTEVMAALVDRFAELETPGCVRVHSVFTSLAKMIDELDDFYYWCTVSAVCRPSDIPDVGRVKQKKLDLMEEFIRDRQASASQRSHSPPPPPLSPSRPRVKKYDVKETEPAPEEQKSLAAAHEKKNKAGNAVLAESAVSVVDDKMADFFNLNEGTSPRASEDRAKNLALTNWVAFEDPFANTEAALVQSTSRLATQRDEIGDGFNDAMASATETNARGLAGSASSVSTRPPGATSPALPPPHGQMLPLQRRIHLQRHGQCLHRLTFRWWICKQGRDFLLSGNRWRGSSMGDKDRHGITNICCNECCSRITFIREEYCTIP